MFSDNAKTYIQLSGAALALTLTFAHEIIHIPPDQSIVNGWMIAMWACFLTTVLSGAWYQYMAAKFLEKQLHWEHFDLPERLQAGTPYGIMLASFYGGALIFTVYAAVRLAGV